MTLTPGCWVAAGSKDVTAERWRDDVDARRTDSRNTTAGGVPSLTLRSEHLSRPASANRLPQCQFRDKSGLCCTGGELEVEYLRPSAAPVS